MMENEIYKLDISDESMQLLKESMICYNNSIYRAAFILAYLSFKVALKDRIIKGKKPDEVNNSLWSTIKNKLNDDNEWENQLNNIVMASEKTGNGLASIFKFNDYTRIKSRYQYWRDVRNSCVHAKSEKITESLVRYFYDYLIQDLPYYYVLGGKRYILDKLREQYENIQFYDEKSLLKTLNECKLIYKDSINSFIDEFVQEIGIEGVVFFDNKLIVTMLNDYEYRMQCVKYISNFLDDVQRVANWFCADIRLVEEVYEENHIDFQKYIIDNAQFFKIPFTLDNKIIIRIIYVVLNNCNEMINESNPVFYDIEIVNQIISEKDQNIIDLCKKYHLFNYFLKRAGNYYFQTSSNDLYNQYLRNQTEDKVEPLLDYIEWNKFIVEKLNYAANFPYELTNQNSIKNRDRRIESIKRVFYKNRDVIERIAKSDNVDITFLTKL